MPNKICHLTSAHPRGDVRIFHKECISLKKRYDVSLIVADGNGDEIVKGISIYDVGKPNGRLDRFRNCTARVYQRALELDAELYHFHDPELLPIGLKLKKSGKKVIYDIHEDVPRQILGKPYLNKIVKPLVSKGVEQYENYVAGRLSGLVTATTFVKNRFLEFNTQNIAIKNFPIIEELSTNLDWSQKEKKVCYVGGITEVRGIKELVKAFEYCETDTKLNLAGKFNEKKLEEEVKAYSSWNKVVDYGFVDRTMIKSILSRSMAGLVTLHPIINYLDALPVKMFEYMLAGIPVISSDIPLWKKIVEDAQCGICVNPRKPKEVARAIDYLINNPLIAQEMGENGRKAVFGKYNWGQEEKKLIAFYEKILST